MQELMIKNIAHTVGGMTGTMSSLEIAKLTGKEHGQVMRDIRLFLEAIGKEGVVATFASTYVDSQGKERPMYNLPKRECLGLAARYDVNLQMAIIDRWAELEYKAQNRPALSPRMQAIAEWRGETDAITSVLSKLGYSQGYLRKEALEIGFRIEGETGEKFVPGVLSNDPEAVNPESLSEHTGTHAAYVAMGSSGETVSRIAALYGKDINPTAINNILCEAGYQTKIKSGKYAPTDLGKMYCNLRTLSNASRDAIVTKARLLFG